MTTQNQTATYFDLHTRGIGYMNRIREVSVRKGEPFMAVTVACLRGNTDDAEYTYIDCRVSGAEAEKLVRRCMPASEADKKILFGFCIGDIYPETFVYQSGKKQGETGVSIKGRLLRISFIKVDGETVYQQPSNTADQAEAEDAS